MQNESWEIPWLENGDRSKVVKCTGVPDIPGHMVKGHKLIGQELFPDYYALGKLSKTDSVMLHLD